MMYEPVLPRYESFLKDESRLIGNAENICFPTCEEEVTAALRQAAKGKWNVTVQGARTGISGAAVSRGGLILSLSRMDRILGLRQDDKGIYYLRVQAGAPLSLIQEFLAGKIGSPEGWDAASLQTAKVLQRDRRQFYPPNPTETTAFIGGMFACNAKGMNAGRYGATADYVEKVTLATAGASLWSIPRGKYVFDETGCTLPDGRRISCDTTQAGAPLPMLTPAAGMDLIDLLAGSEGMLGIVTELELRLLPEPKESWGVVYFFEEDEDALVFAEKIRQWKENCQTPLLTAAEYYDERILVLVEESKKQSTRLRVLPDMPKGKRAALYLELNADDSQLLEDALLVHLDLFVESGGKEENTWAANGLQDMEKFRLLRHSAPEVVNAEVDKNRVTCLEITKTATDFAADGALFAEYYRLYRTLLRQSGVDGVIFGHILENHFHVNLLPKNGKEQELSNQMVIEWAKRTVNDSGSIAAENGVGKLKKELLRRFVPAPKLAVMKGVKNFFDPDGLLNSENML